MGLTTPTEFGEVAKDAAADRLGHDSICIWIIHSTIQGTIHRTIQQKGSFVLEERTPFPSKSPSQMLFNSEGPFGLSIKKGREVV